MNPTTFCFIIALAVILIFSLGACSDGKSFDAVTETSGIETSAVDTTETDTSATGTTVEDTSAADTSAPDDATTEEITTAPETTVPEGTEAETTEPDETAEEVKSNGTETLLALSPELDSVVRTDGSESAESGWKSTGFLRIPEGTACYEYNLAVKEGIYSLAFYTSDKELISGISKDTEGSENYSAAKNIKVANGFVPVPDNAHFVRFSMRTTYKYASVVTSTVLYDEFMLAPSRSGYEIKFDQTGLIATGLDARYADKSACAYDGWGSTDFIAIGDGVDKLTYNLASHEYLYSLIFFDANKNMLSGISASCGGTYYGIMTGTTNVPAKAVYFKCINFVSYQTIPEYGQYSVVPGDGEPETEKLRVVCIGDSLTEGDNGGTPGVANVHAENYPYYLAKFLGCDTANYGKCGYTAAAMLDYYRSGNVKVAGADVVIIMLGTNVGLPADQLSAYRQLISCIRNDNSDAEIFLVTPPQATVDPSKVNYGYAGNVETACAGVKALAAETGLTMFDLNIEAGLDSVNEVVLQPGDGLHFHAFGYSRIARYLTTKLSEALKLI